MSCGLCWARIQCLLEGLFFSVMCAIVQECCDASCIVYTCEITNMYDLFYFISFQTLLPCFYLIMVSIHAANPVGAVSEFIAQLQILELLDNVSNHAS